MKMNAMFRTALLGAFFLIALPGDGITANTLQVFPAEIVLDTAAARQQVVVQVVQPTGITNDVTGSTKFSFADPKLAVIENGLARPLASGSTQLTLDYNGLTASVPVRVTA